MNSSGVIGAVSRTHAGRPPRRRRRRVVQAVADRAVADLVVVLEAHDELLHRDARRIGAARPVRVRRMLAGEQPALPQRRRELRRRALVVGDSSRAGRRRSCAGRRGGSRRPRRRRGPIRRRDGSLAASLREVAMVFGVDERPAVAPPRGTPRPAPRRSALALSSMSACVASSRRPSTWNSRIQWSALSRMKRRTSVGAGLVEVDGAPQGVVWRRSGSAG